MWRPTRLSRQSAGGGVITRFALALRPCASTAAPCQRCSTGDRQHAAQQAKLRRRVGGARCWACACTRGDRGDRLHSLLHAESAPCVPRHPPRCRATVPCMCSDARVNQLYVSRRRMHSGGADTGHKALCPVSLLGTLGVGLGTLDVDWAYQLENAPSRQPPTNSTAACKRQSPSHADSGARRAAAPHSFCGHGRSVPAVEAPGVECASTSSSSTISNWLCDVHASAVVSNIHRSLGSGANESDRDRPAESTCSNRDATPSTPRSG